MKTKNILQLIILVTLASLLFVSGCRTVNGAEVTTVKNLPIGFIPLRKEIENLDNGLEYLFFETGIFFIDADRVDIYGRVVDDQDFLVWYDDAYYINEKDFLKIVELADATAENRDKIYRIGEEIELRRKPYLLKIDEVISDANSDVSIYTIKYTITTNVTDEKQKEIFDHVETDRGTIINEFSFASDGEVQVIVPAGEKINMIVVKSPDYPEAIRKIGIG